MLGVISCHLLLGRAASNPQAHISCEQAGSNNKKQTGGRSPDRSCHLQTLNSIPIIGHVPASKDETCCGLVAGLAPGYNRGRVLSDGIFADRGFANGILADGILANWGVLNNRLRTRHVRSNR